MTRSARVACPVALAAMAALGPRPSEVDGVPTDKVGQLAQDPP
jgi:hypothetical protein